MMSRSAVAARSALVSVLAVLVSFTVLLAQEEKFTDFRGRKYSVEELEKAMIPETSQYRGIPQPGKPPAPEKVSIAPNVFFAFNSAQILSKHYEDLDMIGEVLTRNPDHRFQVEGHTDNMGSDLYNQALSEKRAVSVKQYLVEHFSIAPERLITVGFGESQPRQTNETSEGRGVNRRVEFVTLGD
jgi:outer membrane protein OmpA-like peptidoglycan-associated protein